jgi:GTP-binding protein
VDVVPGLTRRLEEQGYRVFPVSALTGDGLHPLVFALSGTLEEMPVPAAEAEVPVARFEAPAEESWEAEREDDLLVVRGKGIERLVAMTDMNNDAAVRRLQRVLERSGIVRRLRELGAEDGATVRIGATEFDFID